MYRHHPLFPYENEHRDELMSKPFEVFNPRRITLYCSVLCAGVEVDALISRSQCIGFLDETPVYSGIDGRVDKIIADTVGWQDAKYEVRILRELHQEKFWCEIPYFGKNSGQYFLRQLGLTPPIDLSAKEETLWLDCIEGQPFSVSKYRLLAEETVKIILGTDILGRCFCVPNIVFCIEKQWSAIYYLLNKYLRKYKSILGKGIRFEIRKYTRCWPPPYLRQGRLIFSPETAFHAYHGYYERIPATEAHLSIAGCVNKCANYVVPAGSHIGDLLAACGIETRKSLRFVLDGVLIGKSVPLEQSVIMPGNTSLCVIENEIRPEKECIRCHECARVCPVHLRPYKMDESTFNLCIQCGCCSYVCPSNIRLTEKIKHQVMSPSKRKRWISRVLGNYKKYKGKKRYLGRKHSAYVEIAPEYADLLEAIDTGGDAPPHIHRRCVYIGYGWRIKWIFIVVLILLLAFYWYTTYN